MASVVVYLSQELRQQNTSQLVPKLESVLTKVYGSPVSATLAITTMGQPDALIIMSEFDNVANIKVVDELIAKAGWVLGSCVDLTNKKVKVRITITTEKDY